MLSDYEYSALKDRFIAKEVDVNVSAAFIFLSSPEHYTNIDTQIKGIGQPKLSLRYIKNGNTPYSAILNKKSILWYFRLPAFKFENLSRDKVMEKFPMAKFNKKGEITLRIINTPQAKELLDWVF